MATYISLLRGINVSGKNIIKMADLRERLTTDLGFQEVKTYIQSGNIIFEASSTPTNVLQEKIAGFIHQTYGFAAPVMVFESDVWRSAGEGNPFSSEKDIKFKHLTFLSKKPSQEALQELSEIDTGNEEFVLKGQLLYLYMPDGYGRGKLTNNFLEKKLKVQATTRNWKTVEKLVSMI